MSERLTDRQKLFVQHYLLTLNATQAAVKAGYSKKTAKDIGCQNLAKLNIQAAIREVIDTELSEHKLTLKKRIVVGYMQIAFGKKVANNDRVKALDALAKYENLWSDAPVINNFMFQKELLSEGQ